MSRSIWSRADFAALVRANLAGPNGSLTALVACLATTVRTSAGTGAPAKRGNSHLPKMAAMRSHVEQAAREREAEQRAQWVKNAERNAAHTHQEI
ncbi:MAG: hypothetical protein M9919_07275 [Burkholderiaceae bacterium]|nr:hypothetical protein [Burkholderiaceae bacterium]